MDSLQGQNKEETNMEPAQFLIYIKPIMNLYLCVVGIASIIVKLTPTVKDDAFLKKILQFTGRYVALNRTITPAEQKAANKA